MEVKAEIEAKFIELPSDIRERLTKAGATCVKEERIMRRRNFDTPDRRLLQTNGWIRVRDEGGKITMSYKQVQDRTLTGTKEVNVTVNSFDETCHFLETVGFASYTYQETKRESWKLGETEIEIDTWPWIPSFLEVEAPNENELWEVIDKLGLNKEEAKFGSVEIVYQHYYNVTEEEVDGWKEIVFSEVPSWLSAKRK